MLNIKKEYVNKVKCITHPKLGIMHLNFKTLTQEDLKKLNKLGLDIFENETIVDPIHGDIIELPKQVFNHEIDFNIDEIKEKRTTKKKTNK